MCDIRKCDKGVGLVWGNLFVKTPQRLVFNTNLGKKIPPLRIREEGSWFVGPKKTKTGRSEFLCEMPMTLHPLPITPV